MIAIDTNVLVYSVDDGSPDKQAKARAVIHSLLASAESTVLPWQVGVEFLAKLRKWEAAGKLSADEVARRFDEFLAAWVVAIPTVKIFPLATQPLDKVTAITELDSVEKTREAVKAFPKGGSATTITPRTQH